VVVGQLPAIRQQRCGVAFRTESGTVSNIIAVALLALATLVITGLFVFTLVELGKGGLRALST